MAIDSINSSGLPSLSKANDSAAAGSAGALASAKENKGAQKSAGPAPSVDQASFSAAASALSSAKSEAPVDMKKIEAIRAQIQNGTYQVDSQRIAGKMLEEAAQFAGRA